MKRYEVIRDLQWGRFGMNRQYTAEEWVEQAIRWLDADGYDDDREEFRSRLLAEIEAGREQSVIDEIAEVWQIDIQEVKEK